MFLSQKGIQSSASVLSTQMRYDATISGKGIPENNPAQVSHLDLRASYRSMVTGNILYSPTHFPDSPTHIETQTAVRQFDFTSWR